MTTKNLQLIPGFTLVELLIYMGLLSLFLLVLTSIFASILDVQLESQASSSVEEDGRFILARLTYDFGRAKAIVSPATLGSSATSLILNINGINNTFSLSGQDLILTDNTGSNKLNSFDDNVSNLNFTYLANSAAESTISATIRANFTLTSKVSRKNGPEAKTLQTTLGLRKR